MIQKFVLTLIVASVAIYLIAWVWDNEIDIKATVYKISKKFDPKEVIVTIDETKIYQNGIAVAIVDGATSRVGLIRTFERLTESGALKRESSLATKVNF